MQEEVVAWIGMLSFITIGGVLGIMALVAMIRSPYRKN